MSLKRMFLRRIDALFTAATPEEKNSSLITLRSFVETTFANLRPIALTWTMDSSDNDIQNAPDKVLSVVWQIEDLDELIVVRTFDTDRKMILKTKMLPGTDPKGKIESVREIMFTQGHTVTDAWEATSNDTQPDTAARPAPLILRARTDADTAQ